MLPEALRSTMRFLKYGITLMVALLPDTVNQQQLKSWFKGMGPWGHQDTQQRKGATYLSYWGKQQECHL